MDNRACKGCQDNYRVSEEQILRILSTPMFNSDHSVPESVYEERLNYCKECPKLSGYTCSMCGCIVRVTAKLKAKGCPLPGIPLWQPYVD